MALFSISAFVLFHFGLDRDRSTATLASGRPLGDAAAGDACSAVNRLFAAEREQGGLDGLLLAPIDRTADVRRQGDRAVPLPGACSR